MSDEIRFKKVYLIRYWDRTVIKEFDDSDYVPCRHEVIVLHGKRYRVINIEHDYDRMFYIVLVDETV